MGQVTHPVRLVIPISLTRVDGPPTGAGKQFKGGQQLHYVLRQYKEDRDSHVRRRFSIQLAALVARFLRSHTQHVIAASGNRAWNALTVVPSSKARAGRHPLVDVLDMVRVLQPIYLDALTPGPVATGHRTADDNGFTASAAARGRSLLLVDDTLTTGARLQSAASALQLGGADVVAALVIGRVITPEFSTAAKDLWERASATPFTFDRCCLEP
jgi:predicted amidophosphoribosyltransferase